MIPSCCQSDARHAFSSGLWDRSFLFFMLLNHKAVPPSYIYSVQILRERMGRLAAFAPTTHF